MTRAVLLSLCLTGCTSAVQIGREGPALVILAPAASAARQCAAAQPDAPGCSLTTRDKDGRPRAALIVCPVDHPTIPLAQCLAHELRHVLESEWRH